MVLVTHAETAGAIDRVVGELDDDRAAAEAEVHPLGGGAVKIVDELRLAAASLGLRPVVRSEEHTSELQSRQYPVFRLLLEKKINSLPPNSFRCRTTHSLTLPYPRRISSNQWAEIA